MQMIAVRLKDQFRNVMQMWARTIQRGFYFADNRLRLTNQNIELRKNLKEYGNVQRNSTHKNQSRTSSWRYSTCLDKLQSKMDGKFNDNIKFKDFYLTHQYNKDPQLFGNNSRLIAVNNRQYQQRQKIEWNSFAQDANRITRMTFMVHRNRISFHVLHEARVAVTF